jgi:hypothetical protein
MNNNNENLMMKTASEWSPPADDYTPRDPSTMFKGVVTESWLCVDCGVNTAPGLLNRAETEEVAKALGVLWKSSGINQHVDDRSEVYMVRDAVWRKAGIEGMGGSLCVGCLERRIGRKLKPKDFPRDHPFNDMRMPGTPRLLDRRGG